MMGVRYTKYQWYTTLVWNEKFSIGVDAIDKEHQRLFSIINRLFTLRKELS